MLCSVRSLVTAELESKIQKYENERLLVQITGRHGRPIYGERSLKHGVFDYRHDNHWSLTIDNVDEHLVVRSMKNLSGN